MKGLLLESAGPNSWKATWGAGLDAIAYLQHPLELIHLFRYMWSFREYAFMLWLILVQIVALPLFGFNTIIGKMPHLHLGRLGVVRDQAGKARIVAITNWWIQVCLRPLHDAIFGVLRKIPSDGTFDQVAPLERLVHLVKPGQTFFSFDLSAATDRLPIDVQVQILNLIRQGLGDLWMKILRIPWFYEKQNYRYEVGQPMGALSSWGMLALTHHILVHVAAIRAGILNFSHYCILGDDIVIADDRVAAEYLALMQHLGVSINLSKSVQSKDFAEFAKKWVGPKVTLTPVGPGLLLRTLRDVWYMPALIAEAIRIKILNIMEALALIRTFPDKYQKEVWNSLWAVFGLNSLHFEGSHTDGFVNSIIWCFSVRQDELEVFQYGVWNALLELLRLDHKAKTQQLKQEYLNLQDKILKSTALPRLSWPLRWLDSVTRLFSPGFWIYLTALHADQKSLEEFRLGSYSGDGSWETIRKLASSDNSLNVTNIDWRRRAEIKKSKQRAKLFLKCYDQTIADIGGNLGW